EGGPEKGPRYGGGQGGQPADRAVPDGGGAHHRPAEPLHRPAAGVPRKADAARSGGAGGGGAGEPADPGRGAEALRHRRPSHPTPSRPENASLLLRHNPNHSLDPVPVERRPARGERRSRLHDANAPWLFTWPPFATATESFQTETPRPNRDSSGSEARG